MSLTLRGIVWSDGTSRSDDYEVRYEGRTVGRILRLGSTGRELWQWTQIDWGPSYGPNGRVADTLDEAEAAFRQTWDANGAFKSILGGSPRSNEELQQWAASPEGIRALAVR